MNTKGFFYTKLCHQLPSLSVSYVLSFLASIQWKEDEACRNSEVCSKCYQGPAAWPVASCCISGFSPIISWLYFHGKSGGKRLAYLLRQWLHSSSFPSTNMKSGLAGTRKRSRVFSLTASSCLGKSITAEQVGSNTPIYSGEYIPSILSPEYTGVLLLL